MAEPSAEQDALAEDPYARAVVARAIFGPPGPPMTGPRYAHQRRRAGDVMRASAACSRDWAERLLSKHGFHPVFGCDCMPTDEETGITGTLHIPWEKHVADLLFPSTPEPQEGR